MKYSHLKYKKEPKDPYQPGDPNSQGTASSSPIRHTRASSNNRGKPKISQLNDQATRSPLEATAEVSLVTEEETELQEAYILKQSHRANSQQGTGRRTILKYNDTQQETQASRRASNQLQPSLQLHQ